MMAILFGKILSAYYGTRLKSSMTVNKLKLQVLTSKTGLKPTTFHTIFTTTGMQK